MLKGDVQLIADLLIPSPCSPPPDEQASLNNTAYINDPM